MKARRDNAKVEETLAALKAGCADESVNLMPLILVARALRDAGFEVIYTGIRLTPEQIAEAALQDDVKVVALSLLSGAHNTLFPKVVELLKEKGLNDVLVIGGGVIPDADIPGLKAAGIAGVFTPGTPTSAIVDFINANVK